MEQKQVQEVQHTFETLEPGQMVLSSISDYVPVSAGEPLKVHISGIETTVDHKFESEEMETKLVVRFTLDEEVDGKGQVYTAWLRPSINPKSKMYKLLHAVYSGVLPNPLDPTDLLGMPLRITLTPAIDKNGRSRQYVETYLKPAVGQVKVEVKPDVLPTDQQAEIGIEDLDAMFAD